MIKKIIDLINKIKCKLKCCYQSECSLNENKIDDNNIDGDKIDSDCEEFQ
tara:strand:+ start:769 stop:918 length:150 start_codon:yes stop_codon:yes gene_type:complete